MQIQNKHLKIRKPQAEQKRTQNYKLESGQRGEERQRNKQDKLQGLERKKKKITRSQEMQCLHLF